MKTKREELVPGKLIKEITIDEHQHLFWLAVLLILSNILLLFAVIYLVIQFMKWYIWLIDICVLVYCIVQSVRTYKNSSKIRVYLLYNNCLVVKSLLYDTAIDLSQVFEVKPKRTLMDKLAKKDTGSIEIFIKSKSRDKIILRYINEDIDKLCQQILDLANECRLEKKLPHYTALTETKNMTEQDSKEISIASQKQSKESEAHQELTNDQSEEKSIDSDKFDQKNDDKNNK